VRYSSAFLALAFLVQTANAAEKWSVGLSTSGAQIEALMVPGRGASAPTVLIIGGLQGKDASVGVVTKEVEAFEATPQANRPFRLLAVPAANPDGTALQFPPTGVAYRENSESNALWRWIALQAPDLVLIAGPSDNNLAAALSDNDAAVIGRIPAQRVAAEAGILKSVPAEIQASEARQEIERRRERSPGQVGVELSHIYGNDFDQVTYMPGMAVIAQMRMGRTADAARLLAPYLNGAKDSLIRPNSQTLAGHLVFAELAERSKDDRAVKLVRRAAELGFAQNGEMKESMPFHEEMSDSVFMAIPLLAKAGKLTGDRKYFDMAARHLTFMQKLDLRPDGLYRHSPLTDAAWGRGNAFPALGLALALSDFPKDHPEFNRMLRAFQQHISALVKFQDENGMWREVVDYPGAYSEFTATAMIGTAIVRGIRTGWLDARTYQPKAERAWRAILARTGSDGKLIDVCESTGKQQSLNDYLRRAAILNRDQRGGGMAMLFATEMAALR
jgi:rhamnogalacturonyl hydrolase YesR